MRKLEWDGFPRLQMLFLVLLTGVAGLAASYALLQSGVDSMPLRYPLSVGCAYVVFLLLLWLWLRTKAEDYVDGGMDIPLPDGGAGHGAEHGHVFSGGGGHFGGGGASGKFDLNESLPSPSLPGMNLSGVGYAFQSYAPRRQTRSVRCCSSTGRRSSIELSSSCHIRSCESKASATAETSATCWTGPAR
jgi:hypothetical protein